MKILINTVDTSQQGGVANYYNLIRPYLCQDIKYFTVGPRSAEERGLGVLRRFLVDYRDFFLELRTENYDVVLLNPSLLPRSVVRDAIFLLIAKALRKKVIVFFRGWNLRTERIIRKYFLVIFRSIYFRADAFIVLASEFQEKLVEMGFNKKIYQETTTIDDGILNQKDARLDLGRIKNTKKGTNILFLARIDRRKGQYLVLDTFRILKAKYPDVTLTVAGDGPEFDRVKKYAAAEFIDGVEFPGFLQGEKKRAALSNADIYFFPTSYGEGMPNSVLEAMAYGLPIVTRPVGGVRDFFEDGRMGFITESLSCNDFATLVEKLFIDCPLRLEMGKYNRRYARKHWIASKVAHRLEAICREIGAFPV